jgi:5-formyltetrahydrofolate cyclo-ligase
VLKRAATVRRARDRDRHTARVSEHAAAAAKARLRAEVLARRAAMNHRARTAAGEAIARHGSGWHAMRVAAYLAIGTEPPTQPLLDALATDVLLPVIAGDDLDWALDGERASGPLGIDQPTGERLGSGALDSVDVIFVPALAVDQRGNRLGRGRGYYDRALRDVTATIVAIVYDDELLDAVPADTHDRRVDAVLRPSGLLTLG